MTLDLTTPALLFPAISLLLLAFTNRFLALAALIRELHARYQDEPDEITLRQLSSLRYRVILIRNMQAFGVASILLCTLCMLVLFAGWTEIGQWIFAASLTFMVISLAISFREIQISVDALEMRLSDIEDLSQRRTA
jgi:Zn-dependent membrane protease YugP